MKLRKSSKTYRDCERTNSVEIKRVEHKNIFQYSDVQTHFLTKKSFKKG
jgi:hypothetical protein